MRKTIRDAVKAALEPVGLLTLVAIGRRHAITSSSDLPAAIIYTDSERSSRSDTTTLEHELELKVELYVKPDGETAGEDDLDELVAKADALIIATVGALTDVQFIIQGSLDIDSSGEADADYLLGTRTYSIIYYAAI